MFAAVIIRAFGAYSGVYGTRVILDKGGNLHANIIIDEEGN